MIHNVKRAYPWARMAGRKLAEVEIHMATLETDHRQTYTTSHAYQPEAISLAIENGVRCIEHGNLIDDTIAAQKAYFHRAKMNGVARYGTYSSEMEKELVIV